MTVCEGVGGTGEQANRTLKTYRLLATFSRGRRHLCSYQPSPLDPSTVHRCLSVFALRLRRDTVLFTVRFEQDGNLVAGERHYDMRILLFCSMHRLLLAPRGPPRRRQMLLGLWLKGCFLCAIAARCLAF